MTNSYHARIRLTMSAPEKKGLESIINVSVELPIYCPNCGPKYNRLKKDGFDQNHREKLQLFYCKRCHRSFYVHTSWVAKQLSEILLDRIVTDIYVNKLSAKAVAAKYQLPESVISVLHNHFEEVLTAAMARIAQERLELAERVKLTEPLSSVIWWDETFFTLGGDQWYLLLLIDAQNRPLGWKFSRTRKYTDYLSILGPLMPKLPSIPIFVGDGWSAYHKTCERLGRECYLIEHVHSHPWEEARLHHFRPITMTNKTEIISISLPYDAFVKDQPVKAYTFKRVKKIITDKSPKRRPGRPKGSKDKVKRKRRCKNDGQSPKKTTSRRGPKSLRRDGRLFSFSPKNGPADWSVNWLSAPPIDPNLSSPTITDVTDLLTITYKVMKGKTIQSNRIESFNRLVKDVIPDRGLRSPAHLSKRLDHFLTFKKGGNSSSLSTVSSVRPLSVGRGFACLPLFLSVDISQITVVKSVLGGGS